MLNLLRFSGRACGFAMGALSVSSAALAEPLALSCRGVAPDWTLELTEDAATFFYFDRTTDMTIPQQSQPDGVSWPRAMTLIGPRDSAIVILEAPTDQGQPARVLTQRGQTPVFLIGTCEPAA